MLLNLMATLTPSTIGCPFFDITSYSKPVLFQFATWLRGPGCLEYDLELRWSVGAG